MRHPLNDLFAVCFEINVLFWIILQPWEIHNNGVIKIQRTKEAPFQRGFHSAGTSDGGSGSSVLPYCPSSQELRSAVGQPPRSPHQGDWATLCWDGVPPTKPDHIDPRHHPGPLMEVLGVQTPPPPWQGRQVGLCSSPEAAGPCGPPPLSPGLASLQHCRQMCPDEHVLICGPRLMLGQRPRRIDSFISLKRRHGVSWLMGCF